MKKKRPQSIFDNHVGSSLEAAILNQTHNTAPPSSPRRTTLNGNILRKIGVYVVEIHEQGSIGITHPEPIPS